MSQPDPRPNPPPPAHRLLVVDDSPEGRQSLARLLELYGFRVESVGTGAEALAILAQAPPPDVVLTDLFLPDLDGRDIARAANLLQPRPIVGLITGWSFADEDPTLSDLGVDWLFLKPIDTRSLVEALRQALQAKG